MFGYIRAFKPEMKFKEYDIYKGVYCSVCRDLGKRYGFFSRMTLSYDITFLALVRLSLKNECVSFEKSHCVYNPAKKCLNCRRNNDIAFCSDVAVIMVYWSLIDKIQDNKFIKAFLFKILALLYKIPYKKAKKNQPEVEKIISNMMNVQNETEASDTDNIDLAADPSAKAMSEIICMDMDYKDKEKLSTFGYLIGRWVYLIDAVDDYYDDIKSKNYNPIKSKGFNKDEFKLYSEHLLNSTQAKIIEGLKELQILRFKPIIENVVVDGMYNSMVNVISKIEGVNKNEKSI